MNIRLLTGDPKKPDSRSDFLREQIVVSRVWSTEFRVTRLTSTL